MMFDRFPLFANEHIVAVLYPVLLLLTEVLYVCAHSRIPNLGFDDALLAFDGDEFHVANHQSYQEPGL